MFDPLIGVRKTQDRACHGREVIPSHTSSALSSSCALKLRSELLRHKKDKLATSTFILYGYVSQMVHLVYLSDILHLDAATTLFKSL